MFAVLGMMRWAPVSADLGNECRASPSLCTQPTKGMDSGILNSLQPGQAKVGWTSQSRGCNTSLPGYIYMPHHPAWMYSQHRDTVHNRSWQVQYIISNCAVSWGFVKLAETSYTTWQGSCSTLYPAVHCLEVNQAVLVLIISSSEYDQAVLALVISIAEQYLVEVIQSVIGYH